MAAIAAPPQLTFTNSSGLPFAGYKLFTYVTNTTTKKTTFSTAAGMETNTNPNSNPIILDANGSAPVWFPGTIKYVLAPPDDSDPPLSAIATWDSVPSVSTIQIDQFFETPSPDVISLKSGINFGIYSTQFIVDENQNPYIQFVKIANAINYVKITNAATGNPPRIESAGGDTDVGLLIAPKNAGSINVTATSGNITATSSAGTVELSGLETNVFSGAGGVNITADGGIVNMNQTDTRTNSVSNISLSATTSGVPSNGIGVGAAFNATSLDEPSSAFGVLKFTATDVSAGSEDTKFTIQTRTNGATPADTWEFLNGANKAVFTQANTATRTYTFPDVDIDFSPIQPATNTEQVSGLLNTVYTSPLTQQFHPSAVKAWASVNGVSGLASSYNIPTVVRTGVGKYDLALSPNMTTSIVPLISAFTPPATPGDANFGTIVGTAPGFISIETFNTITGTDPIHVDCLFFVIVMGTY